MEANMIGAYGPWAAGLAGRGPGAALVPPAAVPGRRARRLARPGARAAPRLLAAAGHGRSPESPGPASARPRRAARRAPELAAPLRTADGGRLPEAGRRAGPAPRRARPARSWRQQVFRLAQDRPDRRPAPPDDERAPRRLLRRRELGQRAGQARVSPSWSTMRSRSPAGASASATCRRSFART